jgi:uncharacterized damage-inducible protein DinB
VRTNEIFLDGFTRVRDGVRQVIEGLSDEDVCFRADEEANSVAWLVWHLTRVQDDHVAELAGRPQTWTAAGWAQRFALPLDVSDTGYGHKPDDVGAVRAGPDQLRSYHDAVFEDTARFLEGVGDDDLDRIVDRRWDPPVTLGVRLMSVLEDDFQHLGQAAFVRGLLERHMHGSALA